MEIAEIVANATPEELDKYLRVQAQNQCRGAANRNCAPGATDKSGIRILLIADRTIVEGAKPEYRAWKYCSVHEADAKGTGGQKSISFDELSALIQARRTAIADAIEAERLRVEAAEANAQRLIDEAADAERLRNDAERIAAEAREKEDRDIAAAVEFISKTENNWFKNWSEEDYRRFLDEWPEAVLCMEDHGADATQVMIIPTGRDENARTAEVKAVCDECHMIASSIPESSGFGAVSAFPYPVFRGAVTTMYKRMTAEREAREAKLIREAYLRFNAKMGRTLSDEEADTQLASMAPAALAVLKARAEAGS